MPEIQNRTYYILFILIAAFLSIVASHLQVHYTLISFTLLPFAIFLAGSLLGEKEAMISQALFSLFYLILSELVPPIPGISHTPISFGYIFGAIPACWLVARLSGSDKTPLFWRGFCFAMAVFSVCIFIAIKDAVHIYYKYTLALSLALVFLYYLRLKSRISSLLTFTAALLVYYLCGLCGLLLRDGFAAWKTVIFRGYFVLLPGDLLVLVISVYLIPPAAERFKKKFFLI